ncbi:hypothetical protein BuS5_01607 [Desulfosarcina sp. BuS5]|nr:hypothetical protein BuS5_01607 [Desulfosarcina sp. BuS5]
MLRKRKRLDLWLKKKSADMERRKIDYKVTEVKVNLKGKSAIGFKGIFQTNFLIIDCLWIRK